MLNTFQDVVQHLLDLGGANAAAEALRDARRAAQNAYRDIHNGFNWTYLYKQNRLGFNAPYQTGTIQYTHTGGAFERVVTLTGGTWPSWAKFGTLVVPAGPGVPVGGQLAYEVDDRKSDTQITLTADLNPGQDIAALTTFTLYRDTYQLPVDMIALDELNTYNQWWGLTYVHPREWLFHRVRLNSSRSGYPQLFTIRGDPDNYNRLVASFYPYPDNNYQLDFIYHRRPRDLQIHEEKTGTVAATLNTATVNGTGTKFSAIHVGSIIRIVSLDTSTATGIVETGPYGFDRNAYYVHERTITGVTNATTLTVDSNIPETIPAQTKYVISDPIDIQGDAMYNAYLRLTEKHFSIQRNMKDKAEYVALAKEAMILAREADSRSFERRRAQPGGPSRGSWHLPLGADIS